MTTKWFPVVFKNNIQINNIENILKYASCLKISDKIHLYLG